MSHLPDIASDLNPHRSTPASPAFIGCDNPFPNPSPQWQHFQGLTLSQRQHFLGFDAGVVCIVPCAPPEGRSEDVSMSAYFRNGSISRNSVPLRKERDDIGAFVQSIDRGRTTTLLRNGSSSRNSVPLWKERRGMASRRAYGRSRTVAGTGK